MVRNSCDLPILRKDFMIDPYQIYETKAYGGDCVLLIVAALDKIQLRDFSQLAKELDLDILIEVHSEAELFDALTIDPKLLGINNRDLTTFEVDKNLSIKLAKQMPNDITVISESGIRTREDIFNCKQHGIHSFLIGESLMKENSPGKALKGNSKLRFIDSFFQYPFYKKLLPKKFLKLIHKQIERHFPSFHLNLSRTVHDLHQ